MIYPIYTISLLSTLEATILIHIFKRTVLPKMNEIGEGAIAFIAAHGVCTEKISAGQYRFGASADHLLYSEQAGAGVAYNPSHVLPTRHASSAGGRHLPTRYGWTAWMRRTRGKLVPPKLSTRPQWGRGYETYFCLRRRRPSCTRLGETENGRWGKRNT